MELVYKGASKRGGSYSENTEAVFIESRHCLAETASLPVGKRRLVVRQLRHTGPRTLGRRTYTYIHRQLPELTILWLAASCSG